MKIRTKLYLGFGIQILLTASLGLYVLFGMAEVQQEFSHVVKREAPAIANARHLSKLVVDMESGERGFCITQNEEFLEPYITGIKAFDTLIEVEKRLVSNNPGQVRTLARIDHLVKEWREKAAKPEIKMARKVAEHVIDAEQLQEILRRGVGKNLIDQFMALGHELEVGFSSQGDWEGAFAVEIIEKCMADREDAQRGFLITGREEFLEKYLAGEQKKLPQFFARLRSIVSERGLEDELSARVDQLEHLTHEWTEKAAEPEIAARREMNDHPETLKSVAALLEAGTGKDMLDEVRAEFESFIKIGEELAAGMYDRASETTAITRNVTIALLLLATCLGAVVAVTTGRTVARPLAKLAQGVEAVGQGHLETRVECESSGEIGSLIRAFNTMTTELNESRDKLEISATTDRLTGLPNRMILMERLNRSLKRSKRDGSRFAILFFDFDHFKVVNDSLGHDVGDSLLCHIADIFRLELRESDMVARFGGDEFVVLLDCLSEWSGAEKMAKRLLHLFDEPHDISGHRIVSTASVGLVTNKHAHQNSADIIRDADVAMYQAKADGRARVVNFDKAMHEQAMSRLSLEADLRFAIEDDQLRLVYQPIVDLTTGAVSGFEALIRWDHPERGVISPVDFIPIAEETGQIIDIGKWVIRTACRQIADWNCRLGLEAKLSMNVNISKRQLLGSSLLEDVLECLREFDVPAEDLNLEITESAIADDRSDVAPLLTQLREHGLHIAMDDFGTGVSSLGALHEYPIDVLKIDQSFVRNLDGDRSLLAVVDSVTTLAENLGITTVAEGIETAETLAALQSIGCTWGQGYYFARPMTPVDAEVYLLDIHKNKCAA